MNTVQLAQTLIRMSGGRDIEIVFTGLRPGEKLCEEHFSESEAPRSTAHPLVGCVEVPPLDEEVIKGAVFESHQEVTTWVRARAAGRLNEKPGVAVR